MSLLDKNRLFPLEPGARAIAQNLHRTVENLPIVSPHGHTNPRWYAQNEAFTDPAQLFVTPDHYIFRMMYSQGVSLTSLGVPRLDGGWTETDGRKIWRTFAQNFHFLRGTPSRMWIDHAFEKVFGITKRLGADTADELYDHIAECLGKPQFRPRALFDKFNIEVIATTESPLDDLKWHKQIAQSDWKNRVITTYRPDNVVDPQREDFSRNVEKLGELTGCDISSWQGYLEAHRVRRAFFKTYGATSTDHGHASARTENLPEADAAALYDKVISRKASPEEADTFCGQMLTEMARMSIDDGLVLQIHPGAMRNHHASIMKIHGPDMGFDIPKRTDYVHALKPMLDAVGSEPGLTIIVFCLDETSYSRELAPLAGVYPALKLGPPWWFLDSAEGMRRFRETTTETAGFYNSVGFNDDTRAFCSIPARHDVARRVDCAYLATLVASGRLAEDEAFEVAHELTYGLVKRAYKL